MIAKCANPACRVRFHHHRRGKFYRFLELKDDATAMEHFWLCACCCQIFRLVYVEGQGVVLKLSQEELPAEASREILTAA